MSDIGRPSPTGNSTFDVAIIGGGPAGLSAAVWLARYLHSVVLIDSGDPRNWQTRGIHGYLGFGHITPQELRGRGREDAKRFGAELVDGVASLVDAVDDEHFRVALEDGRTFDSRRVLLAYGIRDVWPDVPGLSTCYGSTAHHCPDCDGYEARGCRTVVIASGRKAAGMAFNLAVWTRKLVICTNGQPHEIDDANLAKLRRLGVGIRTERIAGLIANGEEVNRVELENGTLLDCERVFFAIGQYPADDIGVQLGCQRDEEGLLVVDRTYRTSVPNVYAAGDLIPGPHLAVPAAADGCIAALAIHKSLLPEEIRIE
ncbi:MAG TPA: NAD(P)/FAD-dependent oxidoreductase [Gemmatimonadaceae bacterium]|nr:NAD(P)/FAD-dependent oxidoreductase [Gemmatimonadaceae bacterium]